MYENPVGPRPPLSPANLHLINTLYGNELLGVQLNRGKALNF